MWYLSTMKLTRIFTPCFLFIFFLLLIFASCTDSEQASSEDKAVSTSFTTNSYDDLVSLFESWREFETPPLHDGAPDYRKSTFESRQAQFDELRRNLSAIDTSGWPINERMDWMIVWVEMNGYDFNQRILKPWERDPAFYKVVWTYKSDVPAHEGPTNHGTLELWQYDFPLTADSRTKFINELKRIAPFYEQARENLSGNARDLWVTGIRDIDQQAGVLADLFSNIPQFKTDAELKSAISEARFATENFVLWLKSQADSKTGPSGIGKENYSWYLQNVHLVPLSWEDELMILKRELTRAWASLKFEEHRNRKLPELKAADSPEAYDQAAKAGAESLMSFLEDEDIVTVKPYWEAALNEHLGGFVPEETRNFFWIGAHYDPRPLYSHFYHWFELARMDNEPHVSPIRRGPLLYNIFDSRNEGTATAVEEMFMQAGLYDDSPRSREIVYIMIAQRAARGIGSLYAHANEMTMEEAGGIHSEYTPRGWMKTEKELLIFEQHLYLRQPGYGTSYITGKYLLEEAMAAYAQKLETEGKQFSLKDFFDRLNSIGNIPIALGTQEMTAKSGLLK